MAITKKRKYDVALFDTVALSIALEDSNCHLIIRELAKRDLTFCQLKKILNFDIDQFIKKLFEASIVIMYRSPTDKEWTYQLSTYGKDKFIEYIKGQRKQ